MDPRWKNLVHKYKTRAVSCAQRNELQKQTNAPSLGRNKFYKIMNENEHKSCHSSSENILIEQSFNSSVTPKPTCNRRLLFCSGLLFRCTIHNNETPRQLRRPFVRQIFTKTKDSRINLQREIKKTRGLTLWSRRFQKQRWNSGRLSVLDRAVAEFGQFFFFEFSNSLVLRLFAGNFDVWKRVISLLSLNTTVVFCKTRFSSHNSVCLLIYSYS